MVYFWYGYLGNYLIDDKLGADILHFGFGAYLEAVR